MIADLEKELELAHGIGLKKIDNEINDVIFKCNEKLFRTKLVRGKPKTKLICNVVPELIAIENKGAEADPANEYLFRIRGAHFDSVYEIFFKPKNLTSNVSFTTRLLNTVPFGRFEGNKDDFHKYFSVEVDRLCVD